MESPSNRDGTDSTVDRVTILTFTLDGARYCVDVDAVKSAHGVADATSLDAAADPWNAGSVSVDGEQVRVVDLPRIFTPASRTLERVAEPTLLVLTKTDDDVRHGWLVDDVDVTETVSPDDVSSTGSGIRFVKGHLELDGEEIIWLDENAIHG
ncbi:chemotaxis protein CheW [Natrialbaceae archaeon A-arb3/5]